VGVDLAMEGMKKLILLDRDWIPRSEGTSLYIRPTMIATEPHLGVRPARTYLFFIIIGPVGAYYKEGLNPVKIHVEDFFVRAAIGWDRRSQKPLETMLRASWRRKRQRKRFYAGVMVRCGGEEICGRSRDHEHVFCY